MATLQKKWASGYGRCEVSSALACALFCREYDLSPSVWCRLERGLQTQHVKSMVTLCEQLNIVPTWLLFGVGPQTMRTQDAAARSAAQVQEKEDDLWGWKQKSETIVDRIRLTDVSY